MFSPGARVRCPFCQVQVLLEYVQWRDTTGGTYSPRLTPVANVQNLHLAIIAAGCPHCGKIIVSVQAGGWMDSREFIGQTTVQTLLPFVAARSPVPPSVPTAIAADYTEASLVLGLSPKASAALSRRCLQAVLRDQGYTQKDLAPQIDAAFPHLPSYLAPNVDMIRNTGNFAAHPAKSTATGEIVEVEPHEAEWNLDVLDMLFDFYYAQPATAQQRRDAMNAKLTLAGKPPLKEPGAA